MKPEKDMVDDYRIVVKVDGTTLQGAQVDGRVDFRSTNPEYARKAASAAHRQVKNVPVIPGMPYKLFPAGEATPMQVLAALYAVDPGRTTLVEAPNEVLAEMRKYITQETSVLTLGV